MKLLSKINTYVVRVQLKEHNNTCLFEKEKRCCFFRWARPTSLRGFSRCGSVCGWVCLRKLVEAELTMTIKMKVVTIDELTPKRQFSYFGDPGRSW